MAIKNNKAANSRYLVFIVFVAFLAFFLYQSLKSMFGTVLVPRVYLKACSLAQNKDYSGAIALFKRVAKEYARYPRGSEALLKIGDCYLCLGDEPNAREYFEEIIRRNTDLCTPEMARKCLNHLDSGHKTEYSGALSSNGKCPLDN